MAKLQHEEHHISRENTSQKYIWLESCLFSLDKPQIYAVM